jgi:hypothetical protein
MRHFKAIITLFLLTSFGLSLLGCGGPTLKEENVVGKWVAVQKDTVGGKRDTGFVIEFSQDKSVSLPAGKGTWAITNDGRVQIDILKMTMFGSLENDLLTITYPDDRGAVVFKRQ